MFVVLNKISKYISAVSFVDRIFHLKEYSTSRSSFSFREFGNLTIQFHLLCYAMRLSDEMFLNRFSNQKR